jgi:hypothetical protein
MFWVLFFIQTSTCGSINTVDNMGVKFFNYLGHLLIRKYQKIFLKDLNLVIHASVNSGQGTKFKMILRA